MEAKRKMGHTLEHRLERYASLQCLFKTHFELWEPIGDSLRIRTRAASPLRYFCTQTPLRYFCTQTMSPRVAGSKFSYLIFCASYLKHRTLKIDTFLSAARH
jgi:hypothetical protein